MAKGKLFLIPSIIAPETSSSVIPASVTSTIRELDYYLVENLRTARRFISSLKLNIKIEDLQFEQLDKTTDETAILQLLEPVLMGKDCGVMSEAGCPGIADPGSLLVKFAHDFGIRVVPMVGPSSILLALMASGFSGQSFAFHGYLPIDKKARKKKIRDLELEVLRSGQTQIFIETPYRNNQLMQDLVATLRPSTSLAVGADLTGSKEIAASKSVAKWKKSMPELNKIPTVFLIGT